MTIAQTLSAAMAMLVLTTGATAQEPALRWGMASAEVETAANAHPVRRGERMGDKQVRSRGHQRLGTLNLEARYFYDDDGLAMIQLEGPPRNCRAVIEVLVEAHGEPVRVSDQVILRLVIWHDEAAERRVRLLISQGLCDVHYERLAEYREQDLASAPN